MIKYRNTHITSLVVTTLVLVAVIAVWFNFGDSEEQVAPVQFYATTPVPEIEESVKNDLSLALEEELLKIAQLEQENVALKNEIARLNNALEEAQRQEPESISSEESVMASSIKVSTEEEIEELWLNTMKLIEEADDLPGIGDEELLIQLLTKMFAQGEPGILYMLETLKNPEFDEEIRDILKEVLPCYPDKLVLESFLELTDESLLEAEHRYNAICRQIAFLETSEVEPYAARLIQEINDRLTVGTFDHSAMNVLTTLALHHENPSALRLLRDSRITSVSASNALQIAFYEHTNEAQNFVRRMVYSNDDPYVREMASNMLDEW